MDFCSKSVKVFSKEIVAMYIVCSKYDNSLKKSKMLSQHDSAKIIFAEEFVKNFKKYNLCEKDIFYILCQCKYNKKLLKILSSLGVKIVNKTLIEQQPNKFDIQKKLQDNNILIPKILEFENLQKSDFPIFCKGKKHAFFNAIFFDSATLYNFFKKFPKKQFYLESFVNSNKQKAYFVNDKVFICNPNLDKRTNIKIQEVFNVISNIFDASAFSAEFFVLEDDICVFDMDFQTGFFENYSAQKEFFAFFEQTANFKF